MGVPEHDIVEIRRILLPDLVLLVDDLVGHYRFVIRHVN